MPLISFSAACWSDQISQCVTLLIADVVTRDRGSESGLGLQQRTARLVLFLLQSPLFLHWIFRSFLCYFVLFWRNLRRRPLCLCDNKWWARQILNWKGGSEVKKHKNPITIQLQYSSIRRRYRWRAADNDKRNRNRNNGAANATVTTRMKWNLILKQAFDHRCAAAAAGCHCGLWLSASVCVDVMWLWSCGCGERAWHIRQSSATGEGRCCCCCFYPRQQRHTLRSECNLQVITGDS